MSSYVLIEKVTKQNISHPNRFCVRWGEVLKALINVQKMTNQNIALIKTEKSDLESLFQFQLDHVASHLAAFTPKDHGNKVAYIEKYSKILIDPTKNMQTIKLNDVIIGSISTFVMENELEITYWIDRKFWGQGIGTAALSNFLQIEKIRPIFGRVAFDNYGSQKVLEKCGFVRIGKDSGFANARQAEIEEFIYKLSE
ncbi:MAG: GNAT family N-acetyltransferase [Bacteroidia bacterium]